MKFDIEKLKQYDKDNWIYSQSHPSLPLRIYNYSEATQYESFWDDVTLNCRALVLDEKGNVVSKGFKKFFNYSENKTDIPSNIEWVRVYEKLDGSYIGLFNFEGQWIVNSKGSFTSDQVLWAEEILKDKDLSGLNKTWTYCFELIHPSNRIVVDYGNKKDLIFLRAFYVDLEIEIYNLPGLTSVKSYLQSSFNPVALKALNNDNEEGFVVKFSNGERCKIKFDEYVRLHGIVTNTTSYDIWRCLMNGDSFNEILDMVPDEYFNKIKKWRYSIMKDFYYIKYKVYSRYSEVLDIKLDKDFAATIQNDKYKSLLFNIRKGVNIDNQIIKKCKPRYERL